MLNPLGILLLRRNRNFAAKPRASHRPTRLVKGPRRRQQVHVCCIADKKNADSWNKSTPGSTSTSIPGIFLVRYEYSVILHPATGSSSHYSSVAKRQQFSCPLRTATLSLKFENEVPKGLFCFPMLYVHIWNNSAAVQAGTITSRVVFVVLFFFGFMQQEASIWYHTHDT